MPAGPRDRADRIYVLDAQGVIRHKSMPGPRGWDVALSRAALDALLAAGDTVD